MFLSVFDTVGWQVISPVICPAVTEMLIDCDVVMCTVCVYVT